VGISPTYNSFLPAWPEGYDLLCHEKQTGMAGPGNVASVYERSIAFFAFITGGVSRLRLAENEHRQEKSPCQEKVISLLIFFC
jgi:hypothetical protein